MIEAFAVVLLVAVLLAYRLAARWLEHKVDEPLTKRVDEMEVSFDTAVAMLLTQHNDRFQALEQRLTKVQAQTTAVTMQHGLKL